MGRKCTRDWPPSTLNKKNKGKEPIQSEDNDVAADDELSSRSSPLPDALPPKNNVEAESRKREFSRERRQTERTPEHIPVWLGGTTPPLPFGYPAFEMSLVLFMPVPIDVWGLEDMMSSPLGQHILSYEPPHDFTIPPLAMYDVSFDPYNHMMHFNQAMILSTRNDRLLCQVFPASLKGPALPGTPERIHKLVRRVVGCLRFPIFMLSLAKGKHQLTANHP